MARDALASGDTVTAENFFQHAEHYNRIIMAAQTQYSSGNQPSQPAGETVNGSGQPRSRRRAEQDQDEVAKPDDEAATDSAAAGEDAEAAAPEQSKSKGGNGTEAPQGPASANGSGGDAQSDGTPTTDDGQSEGPVA